MAVSAVKINSKPIAANQVCYEMKRKIFEAASELFSLWGVESVSIRDISKKFRVRPELIYSYFDSKEQLLEGLYSLYKDRIEHIDFDESLLVKAADARPAFEVFDNFLFHFDDRDELMMNRIIQIAMSRMQIDEAAQKLVDFVFVRKSDILRKVLVSLMESGKVKPVDIEACMNIYRHMCFSVSYNASSNVGLACSRVQWQKMIELFFSLMLNEE